MYHASVNASLMAQSVTRIKVGIAGSVDVSENILET